MTTLGTTTIKWIAEDNVGNVSSVSSKNVKLDTSAPTAPSLAYSSPTHTYYPGTGSTVYFQSGATGSFTVTASGSTDGDSGVSGYTYPSLGTGWSNTNGAYSFDATAGTDSGSVTAQNNAGLSSTGTSFTAEADAAAPTSSVQCNTAACSAGWYTSSPVAIDIAAGGEASHSGVMRIVYTTNGSAPTVNGSDVVTNGTEVAGNAASFNISTLGQTTVKWIAEDNVGNVSTVSSQLVKLDTSAPSAPTGFSFTSPTQAYYPGTGTKIFFKDGGTGGFTVSASGAADAQSGIAGYTYPALGSGWSNTGGAYASRAVGNPDRRRHGAERCGPLEHRHDVHRRGRRHRADELRALQHRRLQRRLVLRLPRRGRHLGRRRERRVRREEHHVHDRRHEPDLERHRDDRQRTTASFNVTALGTTTVKWVAEDNVGNISSVSSQDVKLDTTAPTAPTDFTFSAPTNAY